MSDYKDGVNIDRLCRALTIMGCASGESKEGVAASMCDAINLLTNAVEYWSKSAAAAQAAQPEAVGGRDATEAYAQGRGDQFEDDSAVIRLLLENCDDADQYGDGQMNTTRIRELLSHFDATAPTTEAAPPSSDAELQMVLRWLRDRDFIEEAERVAAIASKGGKL